MHACTHTHTHTHTHARMHTHSFPPPWRVPKRRKSGRFTRGGRDCYDPSDGNIYPMGGKEYTGHIKTHNRFSLLRDGEENMEEVLHSSRRRPDSSPAKGS